MATTSRRSLSRAFRPARNGRRDGAPIYGTARLGRRTKDLVKRLGSADVAVIDHRNLDRIAAEELALCGVRAVLNVSPSSDGSYPNAGPLTLVRTGIPLIDIGDPALFEALSDGDPVMIDGNRVFANGTVVAEGHLLEVDELARELDEQRRRIDSALHDFTENTMSHIREEAELLSGTIDFPDTQTRFRDRHVLIVVRGTDHIKDLRALRAYIQDVKPILVGVDGGADAIVREGLKPDVILGDMDSVTSEALTCGAEVVVHAYPDGRAPGKERVEALGITPHIFPGAGTSEDMAMLLAYEADCDLIVAVGSHASLVEFLDKKRPGMASTFLVRLKVGAKLVDAKGVNRLYRQGVRRTDLLLLVVSALVAMLAISLVSEPVRLVWQQTFELLKTLIYRIISFF